MKKLSLLLFVVGLGFITFTGTNCRKKPPVTPAPKDTLTTQIKDTSGQDILVSVKESITASAKPVPGCVVYMINNFDDFIKFENAGYITPGQKVAALPAKANYKVTVDTLGTCMFNKVKPASGVPIPGRGNSTYSYYIVAYKIDQTSGDTLWGNEGKAYNGGTLGNPVPVAINNFQGKPEQITVVLAP